MVSPVSKISDYPKESKIGFTILTPKRPFHVFAYAERVRATFLYAFSAIKIIPDRPSFTQWEIAHFKYIEIDEKDIKKPKEQVEKEIKALMEAASAQKNYQSAHVKEKEETKVIKKENVTVKLGSEVRKGITTQQKELPITGAYTERGYPVNLDYKGEKEDAVKNDKLIKEIEPEGFTSSGSKTDRRFDKFQFKPQSKDDVTIRFKKIE